MSKYIHGIISTPELNVQLKLFSRTWKKVMRKIWDEEIKEEALKEIVLSLKVMRKIPLLRRVLKEEILSQFFHTGGFERCWIINFDIFCDCKRKCQFQNKASGKYSIWIFVDGKKRSENFRLKLYLRFSFSWVMIQLAHSSPCLN